MKKDRFILIKVKEDYIEYLRKYDSKVQINSSDAKKDNKPFVGVLFEIDKIEYFVPISSNKKDKLYKMFDTYVETNKKPIDMFFIEEIQNGKRTLLSVLNLNNMIPINEKAKITYNIEDDKDYSLLVKEIAYCNKHREEIKRDSKKIYNAVKKHTWASLEKRCCNFSLLEEKSREYTNISNQRTKLKSIYDDFDIEK